VAQRAFLKVNMLELASSFLFVLRSRSAPCDASAGTAPPACRKFPSASSERQRLTRENLLKKTKAATRSPPLKASYPRNQENDAATMIAFVSQNMQLWWRRHKATGNIQFSSFSLFRIFLQPTLHGLREQLS
jgi:hypothetical protein